MITRFYERHSQHLLWCLVFTFPVLYVLAEAMPANNDVEAWLPRESAARSDYETFKADFGVEETIVVGLPNRSPDDPLVEAVAARIERLRGIRGCWTPQRFEAVMQQMDVEPDVARERLRGLVVGEETSTVGLVALLSDHGLTHRAETVAAVRAQLDYCQLQDDELLLSGAPVVVTELDRLGNRSNNKRFFLYTLAITLLLLRVVVGRWPLALAMLGTTIWAIECVLAGVCLAGGEMNFIMGSLSIMVMVFTMAVSIHFVHYHRDAQDRGDPLGHAFGRAWKPCCLATLTTVIGLVSLTLSDMPPVVQFGTAAAFGSTVALFVGLIVTPALLVVFPPFVKEFVPFETGEGVPSWFARAATWILDRPRTVTAVAGLLVIAAAIGVPAIQSRIDPLDFLPREGKVASDVRAIEQDLTKIDTVEAIVDFGRTDEPFLDKLAEIRRLDGVIRSHPAVAYTMSAATFFPEEMPRDAYASAALLGRAQAMGSEGDFVKSGQRLWRISARIGEGEGHSRASILAELRAATVGAPVVFTGISPLLEHAQHSIFDGFWTSFTTAFLIISAVMIVALRSLKIGLVAMIPNLTPICLVFGTLGWIGFPVDIGMTMTASIALGIAVDGTFHFLVRYHDEFRRSRNSESSSRTALLKTGAPILEAALIASIGMLALTLSPFTPTARFGLVMATLLTTALIGDLVLLPALLSLRRRRTDDIEAKLTERLAHEVRRPHVLDRDKVKARATARKRHS